MDLTLERLWHKNIDCLAIKFKYDINFIHLLKKIDGKPN